jgi:predicted membrane protein
MSDKDPIEQPGPKDQPGDFARNLGDRIRQDVHDQINSKWDERRARREARMERHRQRWSRGGGGGIIRSSGGLFIGLILAGIGAVLLLQNLGIIPDQDLWDFWPVILIVAGASRAASSYGPTGRMWGGVMALAGIVILLANLGYIHHDIWTFFWPVVLIGIGALMLVRGLERNHYLDQWWGGNRPSGPGAGGGAGATPGPSIHRVHEFGIFGGGHRRVDSKEFEGGDIVALFGGVQLDLREAETKLDEMVVDVTAAFGGAEIRVPETWAVSMRVTSIFGGYDDKTHAPPPGAVKPPLLVVTGAVIFGGLAVKN